MWVSDGPWRYRVLLFYFSPPPPNISFQVFPNLRGVAASFASSQFPFFLSPMFQIFYRVHLHFLCSLTQDIWSIFRVLSFLLNWILSRPTGVSLGVKFLRVRPVLFSSSRWNGREVAALSGDVVSAVGAAAADVSAAAFVAAVVVVAVAICAAITRQPVPGWKNRLVVFLDSSVDFPPTRGFAPHGWRSPGWHFPSCRRRHGTREFSEI